MGGRPGSSWARDFGWGGETWRGGCETGRGLLLHVLVNLQQQVNGSKQKMDFGAWAPDDEKSAGITKCGSSRVAGRMRCVRRKRFAVVRKRESRWASLRARTTGTTVAVAGPKACSRCVCEIETVTLPTRLHPVAAKTILEKITKFHAEEKKMMYTCIKTSYCKSRTTSSHHTSTPVRYYSITMACYAHKRRRYFSIYQV